MPLSTADAMRLVREHFERVFPKVCQACGRRYDTLREYVRDTKPRGAPSSFDADLGNWDTSQPMGALTYADCPCGNTMALGTERMEMTDRLALLSWVREQCETRKVTPSVVLGELRTMIREAAGVPKPT